MIGSATMSELLAHPAVQSGALPFAVSLCLAAVLGFSKAASARFAGMAAGIGFLTGYIVTFGWPPLLPIASGQKIAFIAALGMVLGVVADRTARTHAVLGLGAMVAATLWLGWRKVAAAPSLDHLGTALIVAAGAVALFATRARAQDQDDLSKTVPLLVVSLAFSVIAFFGASASIAQNAAALAAALGGLMVLNWPTRRFGLTLGTRTFAVIVLIALTAQLVYFTQAPAWTLALLLGSLFADRLTAREPAQPDAKALWLKPVYVALLALIPAAAAVGATVFIVSSSDLSQGY